MKRGFGNLPALVLVLWLVLILSAIAANAVEVELAGVRLGAPVMNLLSTPGWGEPDGIGPLAPGAAQVVQAQPAQASQAGRANPTARAGGAAARRQGAGAAAARSGVASGGAGGRGFSAGRFGGGGARAGARPSANQTQRGQAQSARQRPQTQQATSAGTGEIQGTKGMQYWLYNRPGKVRVILGVEPSGNIATISAQGTSDAGIFTSCGIGLGDPYFDLFNAYGYPDKTQIIAQGFRINYPDQDVTFTVKNLRVTEISIGRLPAPIAKAKQAQATASRSPASARRAGAGAASGSARRAGGRSGGMRGGSRGMASRFGARRR